MGIVAPGAGTPRARGEFSSVSPVQPKMPRSPLARAVVLALGLGLVGALAGDARADRTTGHAARLPQAALPAPPPEVVASFRLAPTYAKYMDIGGVPILGTRAVDDHALREARWIVERMIGHRPDVLAAIAKKKMRLVVMAKTEMTTDVPEHADLTPKAYWDRRARGLGATAARPATSCAEENLLELPGDPYASENILVHEFAHTIHEHGMTAVDPSFARRLSAAYANAKATGLWAGTYAITNENEYWAEATQSWFDTNRANDSEHGPIDTRAKLVAYDREIAALLREVYGDGAWRYQRPSRRAPADRAHLEGFDKRAAGAFSWPASAPPLAAPSTVAGWLAPGQLPSASPPTSQATTIVFVNRRATDVAVDWIDFQGGRRRYFVLRAGASQHQATYVGHAWAISDDRGAPLGGVVAGASSVQVDIR